MNEVQPIRDLNLIEAMKNELLKTGSRNHLMFCMGINTGLRISDLLKLKVKDVKNKHHVSIIEGKTEKKKRFLLNIELQQLIEAYTVNLQDEDYLFQSYRGNEPIQRVQAYKIINKAARAVGIEEEIGTHTLRKTFGYHFYKRTKDIAMLQEIFNHSSPSITKRYIGINQDEIDKALVEFTL